MKPAKPHWLPRMTAKLPVRGAVTAASYLQRLFPRSRYAAIRIGNAVARADFGVAKYWSIRNGSTYEAATTEVFKRLLRPGDGVIDVGANWGYFSLLAASLVGVDGRVLAIEPVKSTFLELNRNLRGIAQARAVNAAAGATRGRVRMRVPRFRSDTGAHIASSGTPVAMRTIAELWGKPKQACRLLKIDAEGFEMDVLRGCERMLLAGEIYAVVVEVGRFSARSGHSPEETLDFLFKCGFIHLYSDKGGRFNVLGRNDFANVDDNVLALRIRLDSFECREQ